jgi:predicted metal-dependent enzyme (double-stranded beta helix superfamily)
MATCLEQFITSVATAWPNGPEQASEAARSALARLTGADESEPWLADLLAERPATRELHRDAAHGFMLLAHTENAGLYRAPHDHGRAWVVYAVQSGELEIATYRRVPLADGEVGIAEQDRSVLRPGEARIYLPGDIHDTRCLSDTAIVFRFTERDLRHEDLVEGKVTRFAMRDGRWLAGSR